MKNHGDIIRIVDDIELMPTPHQPELVPLWKPRPFMFVCTALAKALRNLQQESSQTNEKQRQIEIVVKTSGNRQANIMQNCFMIFKRI